MAAILYNDLLHLYQQGLSMPADLAFWCVSLPSVEQSYLLPRYLQRRLAHCQTSPDLVAHDQKIVESLRHSGLAITSLASLAIAETPPFWDSAQHLAQSLCNDAQHWSNRPRHTLTATADQLMRSPAIFQWGAAEKLLRIIEAYLELPVAYDALSFYHSVPDGQARGPRRWHRDKEDWRMVKVCVYLHDVDAQGGPFECLQPAYNEQLITKVHPYQRLSDEALTKQFSLPHSSWATSCVGAAGTVVFVDTARYYHRGKPPIDRHRSAIFYSYFSQRPKNPFYCGRSPLSQSEIRALSQELPPAGRSAALWFDQLSWGARLIPKNRVQV
jgi:hypothetical protein